MMNVLAMPTDDEATKATEYEQKVWDMRHSLMPPSGDFTFCCAEELDDIITLQPQIVVIADDWGTKETHYTVNARNRYITWRDILHTLECEKGVYHNLHHRFIEGLDEVADGEYELCCGS